MSSVDVVVVSYGSRDTLRACVSPLAGRPGIDVIVVDNASPDDALETISDLPVRTVRAGRNGGFSFGCNLGAVNGSGDYVLFLNPDAVMSPDDLEVLVNILERDPSVGIVGPKILDGDGELLFTRRRLPRVRSTFAQALFLHRLFPAAAWTDEIVRDDAAYELAGDAEWLSGACLLARRDALEAVGGFDEGFFLYCEDTDLCLRMRAAGHAVRFEPNAVARHQEGSSAPRSSLLAIHTRSRVRYARLHYRRPLVWLESIGLLLSTLTHAVVALPRGRAETRGRLAALRAITSTR